MTNSIIELLFCSQRNGTSDTLGNFNIHTGVEDILKIGEVKNWNFYEQTPYYEGECGRIRGSGGDFFPGSIDKSQIVSLFSPEMCRVVDLDFEEELDINGVKAFKFAGGKRTVDNGNF
jgi:scavenger receptor class B protein 1